MRFKEKKLFLLRGLGEREEAMVEAADIFGDMEQCTTKDSCIEHIQDLLDDEVMELDAWFHDSNNDEIIISDIEVKEFLKLLKRYIMELPEGSYIMVEYE